MSERGLRNATLIIVGLMMLLTFGRWAGLGYEQVSAAVTLGLGALVVAMALRSSGGAQPRSGRSG